jgi:hypothetical protein
MLLFSGTATFPSIQPVLQTLALKVSLVRESLEFSPVSMRSSMTVPTGTVICWAAKTFPTDRCSHNRESPQQPWCFFHNDSSFGKKGNLHAPAGSLLCSREQIGRGIREKIDPTITVEVNDHAFAASRTVADRRWYSSLAREYIHTNGAID